ncbi:MAG: aminoacyl-tRNA hydrolase [Bdellovibrionales bacterium]
MASSSKLIVGLGNPGADYSFNRHNIGFMALDTLAAKTECSAWQKKFDGEIAKSTIGPHAVLLFKPMTYMNLSGQAVQQVLQFYKLTPEDVIVIHDDIDLLAGQVKVKQGGGAGGHNGLKSLDQHIGKNYWRVRLGVGRPDHKGEVTNYVLGDFAKSDSEWLEGLLGSIPEALPSLLEGQPEEFMKTIK